MSMRRHSFKKIILAILIVVLCGIALCTKESVSQNKKASLAHRIHNFHIVAPKVMRGSQPSDEDLHILKKYYGVKTILNLRNDEEHNQREKETVERLGMKYISIPMNAGEEQSIEKIEQCLSIIGDESNRPLFVHCRAGKDRTGLVFAAYRIKFGHWSLAEALEEMLAYGYDRECCGNLEKSLFAWNEWRAYQPKSAKAGL